MNKKIKLHDPLARKFLSNLSVAREFLVTYLPDKILRRCDLRSLRIDSGSYIEDNLKLYYSDIVYVLDLKEKASSVYIYTLIEHQSSSDALMPFRILKYQVSIMQKHLDNNKNEEMLPIVIPLVFYNGHKSPYPDKIDIKDLFYDSGLYKEVSLGKFKLIDLTIIDDNELLKHKKIAILEIVLKHIHQRDFNRCIEVIVKALQQAHNAKISESLVNSAFAYLINARSEEEIQMLITEIKNNASYYEDSIMTYAETLKMQGIQEGMQKGIQEGVIAGKEEGKQLAKIEIAMNLLKSGLDESLVVEATKLSIKQIKTLFEKTK